MPQSPKYTYFDEQDFIKDKDFQDWIICPDEEKDRFWNNFIKMHPEKKETVEKARKILTALRFKEDWPAEEKIQSSLREAFTIINAKESSHTSKVIPLYRSWWAAAAVLLLLASGSHFFLNREHSKSEVAVIKKNVLKNDIAPGGNKAILTLANDSTIILDSAQNGTLSHQGNIKIIKLNDGQLAYDKTGVPNSEVLYNTVSTPKGGQYQLTLSDGSKVWLNAESSLRFPAAFSGRERKVELTGEGYFEVAKNKEKPFIVTANNTNVEVLGTHFNINAYSDENFIKTTLLEGSVKVSKGNASSLIVPGEQASVSKLSDVINVKNDVNVDGVVAWKNGKFYFDNVDIKTIMNQIARWYDVDVEYKGNISKIFGGTISRNVSASNVFKILEATGGVHFTIEGRKVIVEAPAS
jgi:transmembrane sensor